MFLDRGPGGDGGTRGGVIGGSSGSGGGEFNPAGSSEDGDDKLRSITRGWWRKILATACFWGTMLIFCISHVHAAYASFLWETEDADECAAPSDIDSMPPQFHERTLASA
ncbi:hypothetical protein CRYUN_Cryun20dG0089700 [Craigia yunnanensis]